jgi:phosphate transport system substrate-binding protein
MKTARRIRTWSTLALAAALVAACGGGSSRSVIQNKGSDTLVNVAQAWAENYAAVAPETAVAVTGGGSGTGISAMINGTVDIANSSRKMKDSEIELARGNGNEPIEFVVGFDALAVFVHPDNPLDEVSLEQLASLYGEGGEVDTWSQWGVEVPGCGSDEIVRVSRQNNSGTYVYFREAVLGDQRDFRLGSRDMHGSKDVVDLVENTPCAIGYSGMAYAIPEVRMPCVMGSPGDPCVAPSIESALDGSYPISRPLLMYTSGNPAGEVKTYLDWVLGETGQCIMLELGYTPAIPTQCVE